MPWSSGVSVSVRLPVLSPSARRCPLPPPVLLRSPSVQHRLLSQWRQQGRLSFPRRPREEVSVGAGRVEPGGHAAGAGADGGEGLLAAAEEGGGVGALLAAEVVVGLPALVLPLPATPEDPDEGLQAQDNRQCRHGTRRLLRAFPVPDIRLIISFHPIYTSHCSV